MNPRRVAILALCLMYILVACTRQEASLPSYTTELSRGQNEIRVQNPNSFAVSVGVRSGSHGKNFSVSGGGRNSIYVPDGAYSIYFIYSNDATALYQGDSFTLFGNGIEIRIVESIGGNYGIRRAN